MCGREGEADREWGRTGEEEREGGAKSLPERTRSSMSPYYERKLSHVYEEMQVSLGRTISVSKMKVDINA